MRRKKNKAHFIYYYLIIKTAYQVLYFCLLPVSILMTVFNSLLSPVFFFYSQFMLSTFKYLFAPLYHLFFINIAFFSTYCELTG